MDFSYKVANTICYNIHARNAILYVTKILPKLQLLQLHSSLSAYKLNTVIQLNKLLVAQTLNEANADAV